MTSDVARHTVHTLVFRSLKRTHDTFIADHGCLPDNDKTAEEMKKSIKTKQEYLGVEKKKEKVANPLDRPLAIEGSKGPLAITTGGETGEKEKQPGAVPNPVAKPNEHGALVPVTTEKLDKDKMKISQRKAPVMPKPKWHAPWKLYRVISGHIGWVRAVDVEPGNQWFVTGANDRCVKIWDLASGKLKLTLTGHISEVRGVKVSARHPYLFSCGQDHTVKCWDLEYNRVIRHYHGHLSSVYGLDLHPTIDILVSVGRDAVARVWDMRTKANIMTLGGHTNTIAAVRCQSVEPQIMTGSHDTTIRLWDLKAGKTHVTLTNHKKSVRALTLHPTQYTFASAAPDNIKQWKFPDGNFIQNISGHNSILNAIAVNSDGVCVSGADNGSMQWFDWRTGYNFQRDQAPVQPGSLDSEAGIFALTFDKSESRLISCEGDKTIKIYKEDEEATEESNPILWKPEIARRKRF